MTFYVYILYSDAFDRFYIGQTKDVEMRLQRHNAGIEKSTAQYIPWSLKWSCEKPNRTEAMKLEIKLKNLTKPRLKEFIVKYNK
jgi:putative endonuclease